MNAGKQYSKMVIASVIFLTSGITSAYAQSGSPVQDVSGSISAAVAPLDEKVLLKTDRDLYLCGEDIYFTAFTIEGNWFLPVSLSSVLYMELYSQENRVISKGKFSIKDGKSSGKISIPRPVSTDFYYLRAYTRYMQNFGVSQFYERKLKIVNPFYEYKPDTAIIKKTAGEGEIIKTVPADTQKTKLADSRNTLDDNQFFTPISGKARAILKTSKNNFGNREEVKLVIHVSDDKGRPLKADLSLFVSLSEARDEFDSSFIKNETMRQDIEHNAHSDHFPRINNLSVLKYLPETRGDIISGNLFYPDKKPAGGIEVLQSFVGRSACVESCVTGKDGSFLFLTDDDMNMGDLILKVVKPDRETIITLDEEFCADFSFHPKEILTLSEDEIDLIKKQFVNIQVDDAFRSASTGKTDGYQVIGLPFYDDISRQYRFSDFAKLPNMKEFIFEIIEGVVLAKEDNHEVINIIDERSFTRIGQNPLMIIDGVPVSEASAVLGLDPEKVQYARVVRDKYFYKKQVFDGILDITTYKGDASSFDLPVGTFRYSFERTVSNIPEFKIEPAADQANKIPFYKNMIYFKPDVSTGDMGTAEVHFLTPDNSGTFVIKCFGLTPDGMAMEGDAVITVGENQSE